MAVPDSYMRSVGNVAAIFEAIKSAGVPQRFTHEFLKQLGFTSSNDRAVIAVMKALRFLDENSVPTERYRRFRDPSISGAVMAEALRDAYADLFTIHETAYDLPGPKLTGAFKRIAGKGDSVSQKMASTFKALAGLADWSSGSSVVETKEEPGAETPSHEDALAFSSTPSPRVTVGGFPLHHDIHIHLPVSTDVRVYDAIFRSLREHLR